MCVCVFNVFVLMVSVCCYVLWCVVVVLRCCGWVVRVVVVVSCCAVRVRVSFLSLWFLLFVVALSLR